MANPLIKPEFPELSFRAKEAINTLRGNIQMAGADVKLIAFTSSNANEGKSMISINTARSLAALEKKTLLLDCDIRNSQFRRKYGIKDKNYGLSEYLCGRAEMGDIVTPTDSDYLNIIFAGRYAPNPSELLSSERFQKLVEACRGSYDYVIVDTPPANLVVDAMLVAAMCDTSIIVAESCVTDRRDVLRVKNKLIENDVSIMGIVLNKVPLKSHRYGYGHGKYGRYGYSKYGYDRSYAKAEEYARAAERNKDDK